MKAMIARAGYVLDERQGIWLLADYAGISFSDGGEVEERIGSIINEVGDLSVLSEELRQHCRDWPFLYHLSPQRANILRPFEHYLGGDVLEIGAGCGAITRYLGECGGNVLALEGSPRRAAIARARTRDLSNVEVVADCFDDFRYRGKFDVVTLIGVLEYANLLIPGKNPPLALLERARSFLKPGGVLIIAIENQLGLKYFAGALEDHLGKAMYGIEGGYRSSEPQTFGRKAMVDLLTQAGYTGATFLAPFPDYKLPVSIIAESGFLSSDFEASTLISQSVFHDPQLPQFMAFLPELVWPAVEKNGLAFDLANSFLIVAGNGNHSVVEPDTLAWHYTTNRRKPFCKETRFVRTQNGQIEVRHLLLASSAVTSSIDASLMKFHVPEKSTYVHGQLMSQDIIELLSRDGWIFEDIILFFRKYIQVLEGILSELNGEEQRYIKIYAPDVRLPGICFDIVPHNIIVTEGGEHYLIDKEWSLEGGLDAGFLIFRSLLQILFTIRRLGHSSEEFDPTPLGLIVATMRAIGWPATPQVIVAYAELEARIQQVIQGRPSKLDQLLEFLMKGTLVRNNLNQQVEENSKQLALSCHAIAQREQAIAQCKQEISQCKQVIVKLDQLIAQREQAIMQREGEIFELSSLVAELRNSTSWKITAPFRFVGRQARRIRRAVRLVPDAIAHSGGAIRATRKVFGVLCDEGVAGLYSRLRFLELARQPAPECSPQMNAEDNDNWDIVPHYVDPLLDELPAQYLGELSVAVHLHLSDIKKLEEVSARFANMPCAFDLFVSVPEGSDCADAIARFQVSLPRAEQIAVEMVPNRGRDLAPLIVQFGKRLSHYTIIGHFHSEKQLHCPDDGERNDLFDHLLGPLQSTGGRIAHFLELLQTRAKLIYSEGHIDPFKGELGWAANHEIACDLLERHSILSVNRSPHVEILEGSMFWARSICLRDFLALPLSFDDFPEEPVSADGTLVDALECLILAFAHRYEGQFLRLVRDDSIRDYRGYEERQDFSSKVAHADIKVLAYYLPQFHPIPENDEWHGKGFTEWTKVRAANPLFKGHYQQHIPHPDIGYYLLDTPETLRMQAKIMRTAGVHGMVFYHYWFGGRMILEHPARMLLDTPDIAMPYCFCWANENWTRRWDGNESEILLAQNYSPEDARAFIRYMIPFFQDPRYIRVHGRPVILIYRPASIPEINVYIDVWAEECRTAGLLAPYLVAVLTRGATHPAAFGMDAGVERVLNDWTGGNAPEIKATLKPYEPINGSVLAYNDVANFYSVQTDVKDFTYFRSLVPSWDNTARYGSEAYVVHGSTPERFQEWFESAIHYSKQSLPADRRFIFVNAWNEWAEGAHLEPDTRYGYAYLNAVGRALSGIPYSSLLNPSNIEIGGKRIHLRFQPQFCESLTDDAMLAQRFFNLLARSTIFDQCIVTVDAGLHDQLPLPASKGKPEDAELILEFRKPAFFGPRAIEKMVQSALAHRESIIVPNAYRGDEPLISVAANGSILPADACSAPMVLFPILSPRTGFRNFLMRTDARCFVAEPNTEEHDKLPVVTTIVRIHKSADLELLSNALYCLAAMHNCICMPLIAAQDLEQDQSQALASLLEEIPWYPGYAPKVDYYYSPDGQGDMRSRMLNESLRKIRTRYAGFLDYDDLLMRDAYEWLIGRLCETGKAVAFGRVFSTSFSNATGVWLERTRIYEYGYSYEDFIKHNHAPIHSFLMDMSRIDLTQVSYYDDQRYLEDYLLTLQIFTHENCDWDGLKKNKYIGDYIHSVDRSHTLAFANDADRHLVLNNTEFLLCNNRIQELRQRLLIDEMGISA